MIKNKNKNKKWELIICDKDLNVRIGKHSEPKVIKHNVQEFDTKEELLKEYNKLIDKYMKISYDWKGHSEGALKFYHGCKKEGKDMDILTYLLVYYNGEEVMEGLFDSSYGRII